MYKISDKLLTDLIELCKGYGFNEYLVDLEKVKRVGK